MSHKQTKTRPPVPLPTYVRFSDLHDAGIVANWTILQRLIAEEGFPTGVMLSRNVRAWEISSIQRWLSERPTALKTIVRPWRRARRLADEATKTSPAAA
jgi:hypothetical protein